MKSKDLLKIMNASVTLSYFNTLCGSLDSVEITNIYVSLNHSRYDENVSFRIAFI